MEDWHTYFVSGANVLVHNMCAKPVDLISKTVKSKWYKATFSSVEDSIEYHLKKHGNGRTIEQYTNDAMKYFKNNKKFGTEVTLKDGTKGIKIQTGTGKNKAGGYWTKNGKLVTFWD